MCPSYSRVLVVPASITDDVIRDSAKFRALGRFPVLCYKYQARRSYLVRSSQPLPGPTEKRSKADEKLLNAYLQTREKGIIIDTRTEALAQAAKSKGGGTELGNFYPYWKREHKPVEKHAALLNNLAKFIEGKYLLPMLYLEYHFYILCITLLAESCHFVAVSCMMYHID